MKWYWLFLLLFIPANLIYCVEGEIIFELKPPSLNKIKVLINNQKYAWEWDSHNLKVIASRRTFPISYDKVSNVKFDAPKSIDTAPDSIPWGIYGITVSCYDNYGVNIAFSVSFTLDLRDEDWSTVTSKYSSHDTHFQVDPSTNTVSIERNGSIYGTISSGRTYRIWQIWGAEDPNTENFTIPVTLKNRLENGSTGFGYLVSANEGNINSDNPGHFKDEVTNSVSHGTIETSTDKRYYSFQWSNENIISLAGQNSFNSTNNVLVQVKNDFFEKYICENG